MRFPENLQEENVIVLEMILLTLQMTVLKLTLEHHFHGTLREFLFFSAIIIHPPPPPCDLAVTALDTARSDESFAKT